MPEKVTAQVGTSAIEIETGALAKQADGSVTVRLGDTIVLTAAVAAATPREGVDFLPLTVDYREKAAAVGRFPGGYFKREGRPTEKEILTCRMTDRPIRPLFPKGWYHEVQVQSILLSGDGENDSDILSIIGASAALTVSDIPWAGPLGAVRVGRVKGEFVANPTHSQLEESDLDLVYVGTEKEMVMFEGSAREIPDADFVAALHFAQTCCEPLIAAQKELAKRAGKPKREIVTLTVPEEIYREARELAGDRIMPALLTEGKMARQAAWNAITEEVGAKLVEKHGEEKVTPLLLKNLFYALQRDSVRELILDQDKRLDGRPMDAVRPITCQVGLIPRAHGSAVFSRGETQALCLATLGTTEDGQHLDAYTGGADEKQFLLHYNFPNFSVGETGRIMGPGRREIGHGALAERSLLPMVPLDDFPYAIRVTSEIMESNGSTSMATVCAGSLALMDAGVPLKRPVAGISVGLCTRLNDRNEIAEYKLLTDIIGSEDFFGDMDCKIAGTEKGITGFQLDLKLKGLPHHIMSEAVERAAAARRKILDIMGETLPEPRAELSPYAPRITVIKINPEKIGALIGPGGKNIKRIVDESGCEINIEDDGSVLIYSTNPEGMEVARREVESITAEIEPGKIYRGRVVTIKDFGCFVEIFPGQDGLVHVSELANFRVKHVEDIVKMGDEIWVKCLGIDDKGRVKLSRRAAMEERDRQEGGEAPPADVEDELEPTEEIEDVELVEDEESEEPVERDEEPAPRRPARRARAPRDDDREERAPRGRRPARRRESDEYEERRERDDDRRGRGGFRRDREERDEPREERAPRGRRSGGRRRESSRDDYSRERGAEERRDYDDDRRGRGGFRRDREERDEPREERAPRGRRSGGRRRDSERDDYRAREDERRGGSGRRERDDDYRERRPRDDDRRGRDDRRDRPARSSRAGRGRRRDDY
jgi:polyribonucleotide nucleotidyltransferase